MGVLKLFSRQRSSVEDDTTLPEEEFHEIESNALVPFGAKERHRFAEHLIEKGLVSRTAIDAALQEQRVTGDLLGAILVRNGFLRQDVLVPTVLAFNTSRIATEQVEDTPIDVDVLERFGIIISAVTDDLVYVGSLADESVVDPIIREAYPGKTPRFVAFLPGKLPEFLDRIRRAQTFIGAEDDVREDEMLDRLLASAIQQGASDVHIEPRGSSYSVLFRLLGERKLVHEGTLEEFNTMVAQLKDRGKMDLAERRIGQDGGFQIERAGRYVDLRAVTVPVVGGEKAVIRILDPDRVNPSLDALGISRITHWRRGVDRKDGLCLICGPTGSGKTTTLNATIRELDRFGKSIYTVEDPVEYQIPFVSQVSANPQVGLDYARAIKNFMRADPDVIVIGEIRDAETARNAIKAADTGHLVLGTLHTGSIVSSMSRLRDLEVDPNELRYILRAILVQTLLKVKCTECGGTGHLHEEVCVFCSGAGYNARTVTSECISFDSYEQVDEVIAMTSRDSDRTKATPMPWPEIIDDALDKMCAGVTDAEEIKKVFGSLAVKRAEDRGIDLNAYFSRRERFDSSVVET